MRNKGLIIFLTIFVTLISSYYLSFTWLDYQLNKEAVVAAKDSSGNIDFGKKQAYLDSLWKKPVFTLVGIAYTYQEVRENALKFGLDLHGGMHVTLELSVADLIKGLSGNNQDPLFLEALAKATARQQTHPQASFSKLLLTVHA